MNFYQQTIQNSPLFHSTEIISDISLIEPVTLYLINEVIADAKGMGIDLRVYESYRSQERQAQLFKQGVTELKNVGVHHYGLAADLVKYVNGEPTWDGYYSFLGELAHKHGLISGQDWGTPNVKHSFVDPDHVQFCSVARQNDLFAGTWYPTGDYLPYLDLNKERP